MMRDRRNLVGFYVATALRLRMPETESVPTRLVCAIASRPVPARPDQSQLQTDLTRENLHSTSKRLNGLFLDAPWSRVARACASARGATA